MNSSSEMTWAICEKLADDAEMAAELWAYASEIVPGVTVFGVLDKAYPRCMTWTEGMAAVALDEKRREIRGTRDSERAMRNDLIRSASCWGRK